MQQLAETLKSKQLKVTPQRLAIYKMLYNTTSHPTAEMIYNSLQETHPSMSLATVYKTLDTLKKADLVIELKTNGDSFRYDANVSAHPHGICEECGQVIDIFTDKAETIIGSIQSDTDFEIRSHHLYLTGICKDCQQHN